MKVRRIKVRKLSGKRSGCLELSHVEAALQADIRNQGVLGVKASRRTKTSERPLLASLVSLTREAD